MIVEDDDLTRVSITAVMASAGFDVIASTQTSAEALDAAHQFFPDVALLDLHLGRGPNGIDVAFELRKNDPQIGIVFLTTYEDPRLLSETRDLPQGSQYLLKSNVSNVRDITEAIEHSLQGKSRREKPGKTGVLADLSNVQLATLSLLAQGLSNTEIAKRRHVTEKSVEAVISRLAKALSLTQSEKTNQRVQLARLYFESTGQFRGSS
jgi:DNA-binding NarL/FixJ family response regulator